MADESFKSVSTNISQVDLVLKKLKINTTKAGKLISLNFVHYSKVSRDHKGNL